MDVDAIALVAGAGFVLLLGYKWFSRPVYSEIFGWTLCGISGLLFFFGMTELDIVRGELADNFGLGVGLMIGSGTIGYILTLILFGLGRLLGFIEKAVGVNDKEE